MYHKEKIFLNRFSGNVLGKILTFDIFSQTADKKKKTFVYAKYQLSDKIKIRHLLIEIL